MGKVCPKCMGYMVEKKIIYRDGDKKKMEVWFVCPTCKYGEEKDEKKTL